MDERAGIEPARTALQAAAFPSLLTLVILLAGTDGIEPPTRWASTSRSTDELRPDVGSRRPTRTGLILG